MKNIMERRKLGSGAPAIAIGLLVIGLLGGPSAFGAEPTEKKVSAVAARIDGQVVTVQELEKALAPQLAKLGEQRYQLMQSKLEELIADRLLEREAKRRGITLEALFQAEVLSKIPEVNHEEVSAFITQNKSRLRGEDAELRPKVKEYLTNEKVNQQLRQRLL